ncbi:9549_t:CDS:2, partial [Scutellospora calospora]
ESLEQELITRNAPNIVNSAEGLTSNALDMSNNMIVSKIESSRKSHVESDNTAYTTPETIQEEVYEKTKLISTNENNTEETSILDINSEKETALTEKPINTELKETICISKNRDKLIDD